MLTVTASSQHQKVLSLASEGHPQGGGQQDLGDAKLEADRKADKVAGKVQNAVGGLKDSLRGN
jgi:hypothetical protein